MAKEVEMLWCSERDADEQRMESTKATTLWRDQGAVPAKTIQGERVERAAMPGSSRPGVDLIRIIDDTSRWWECCDAIAIER